MSYDIDILRLAADKDKWARFAPLIKKSNVSSITSDIFSVVGDYWDNYPAHTALDIDTLRTFFYICRGKKLKDPAAYEAAFDLLKKPTTTAPLEAIEKALIEKHYATLIYDEVLGVSVGRTGTSLDNVRNFMDERDKEIGATLDRTKLFVPPSLSYISSVVASKGLQWRLTELNVSLGPLRKGDFIILAARPEAGKCLGKDTPVLMHNGTIKNVQDVQNGDVVAGPGNAPRLVSGVTKGSSMLYRVSYGFGESYVVNEDHILSLKRSKTEGKHKNGDVLNISVRDYLALPKSTKARCKGWKAAVEYPEARHSLHPYFVGLWLGDGTSENSNLTNADCEVLRWLRMYVSTVGVSYREEVRSNQGKALSAIINNGRGKKNYVRDSLAGLNLLNNKHIPHEYMVDCKENRLCLLAGLLDTDGSRGRYGYEITQVRKGLATQILHLARGLGFHATMREKIVNGVSYWRVSIYGDVHRIPVKVERKKFCRSKVVPKRKGLHFGIDVQPIGEGDYYGFCVDQDHLFLLGDYTVTHNTTMIASEASYMMPQMAEDEHILWINNEEGSAKVMSRVVQAHHQVTTGDLFASISKYETAFLASGGNRFLITDDETKVTPHTVERMCKEFKPGLIIFDQLDKVQGFKNDRDDLRIGALYKWARELAKTHCPVIAVSQLDGSAEGEKWVTMDHLRGSKTDKPGEADGIIIIGDPRDGTLDRYISIAKNKLHGGPDSLEAHRHGKFQVTIEPSKARYISHWRVK
jgi:replicative DNA helicase